MITKKSIMEAWTFLREKNYTIPDETLDFMRDVSLKALEQERLSNVPKPNACPQLYEVIDDWIRDLETEDIYILPKLLIKMKEFRVKHFV